MRSLIVALSLAVSAFASDVLVPGNPPLTTGIVQNVTGILEWLAGVNLAAEQHTQVEQLLVKTHRNNARRERCRPVLLGAQVSERSHWFSYRKPK